MKRIEELCDKLYHPFNGYCREKIGVWLMNASLWADKMMAEKGSDAKDSKKVYMLCYTLNHLCPNLVHLKPNPAGFNLRTLSVEAYNKLCQEYTMENSQAEFADGATGALLQEGIKGEDAEYDFLLCAALPVMKANGYATSLDYTKLTIPCEQATKILRKYTVKMEKLKGDVNDGTR